MAPPSTALAVTHDGELLPPRDEGLTMVCSPDEARHRLAELQKFVASVMQEGLDFGTVPGCGDKKVLLQPGAQKLAEIYGLTASYEFVDRTLDFEGGFLMYTIRCRLSRGERVVAECVGSCNSREKKYRNQQCYDVANTILKMAEKRAFVGATISSTRSSGLFTQDILDEDDAPRRRRDWFTDLKAMIADASGTTDLGKVKNKMAWARDKGHVTDEQFSQLVQLGQQRKAAIEAAQAPANDSPQQPNDSEQQPHTSEPGED